MTRSENVPVAQLFDTILILDFGSQYTHLIARRVRELGVYCELFACTARLCDIPFEPKGIILSGSPYSVYAQDSPHVDPAVWELSCPILGICYGSCLLFDILGLQEIAWTLGGKVESCEKKEYGDATISLLCSDSPLFRGIHEEMDVWMSHGDQLSALPDQFRVIANTPTSPFAGIESQAKSIYGIQFHPEVTHTKLGSKLLGNFCLGICKAEANWTMNSFVEKEIERIRDVVGPCAQVIGAVSGGVDSSIAASLMHKAIGDRFHAILVDNGVMRLNECDQVKTALVQKLGINLKVVDASDLFLDRLVGVTDPERKRKIIGNTFIEVFEAEADRIENEIENNPFGNAGKIEFLLQGTLYPDVIESISFKGPSATIKTHHNVGGLLENMKLKLVEPLRELFKDEVRAIGTLMGIDDDLVWRHPFPGPGIAIRVLGEVSRSQVEIARKADFIYIEEIKQAGLYRDISQGDINILIRLAYAALLPVKAVGVMGDQRTYEQVVALRAVQTTDFMTATWFHMPYDVLAKISSRIINEVDGVNRVVYDVSSKPPATIEWE